MARLQKSANTEKIFKVFKELKTKLQDNLDLEKFYILIYIGHPVYKQFWIFDQI